MKKCLYCKAEIDESSVVDICESCGVRVFGGKMLETIKGKMNEAKERGDLFQGSVSQA